MTIDMVQYGAKGDSHTDNTAIIQQAIDTCCKNGGGTLVFEAGIYKHGTIQLKSHTTIILERGATLLGDTALESYPEIPYMFVDGCNEAEPEQKGYALIYAYGSEHIHITGEGTIQGRGAFFADKRKRPFVIRVMDCERITIQGVALRDSSAWCCHLQRSKSIRLSEVKIYNQGVRNADGIDIDSCQDVSIEGCYVDTHDDAICLKATSLMPCHDISIQKCDVKSDCAGIKIGTESIGDFRNIKIEDTTIHECNVCAIKITPVDGGDVRDVLFKNNTIIHSTGPILLAVGKRMKTFLESAPRKTISGIHNVTFENMTITTKRFKRGSGEQCFDDFGQGIVLSGHPDSKITNVHFKNIDVTFYGGVTAGYQKIEEVPVLEAQYPDCQKFGILPTHGYYLHHAEGVVLEGCKRKVVCVDSRPWFVSDESSVTIQ